MATDIDTRVPLDLNPDRVQILDGYDASVAHLLGETETVLSAAGQAIVQVHDARAAADRNPVWNEAARIIETFTLAEKLEKKVIGSFYKARATLECAADALERELSSPVTSSAAHPIASEIRNYVRGLKVNERMTFINQAIAQGDQTSATAILGAPAYLSGFNTELAAVLTRQWHERMNPDAARRVRVMRAAEGMLNQLLPTVQRALEKAVGAPSAKVAALREAKSAAERHFVMQAS